MHLWRKEVRRQESILSYHVGPGIKPRWLDLGFLLSQLCKPHLLSDLTAPSVLEYVWRSEVNFQSHSLTVVYTGFSLAHLQT